MVIQTRVFGRHFLKNKWSLSLQGKQVSVANDKIKVLKRKLESWKMLSTTMSLTASHYLKTFVMKLSVILINVILCQHLEDLHNSVN